MTGRRILPLLCLCLLLTGCSALLEREYSTVEPHSSKFWESEAAGTLRAENYQDIVNDLLILIGQHTESATVRLYNTQDEVTVSDTLEQAAAEVQQETPMGAYAVEFITTSAQAQRGYYEISIQIGYRRTAEQIQAVVNATSIEALYSLLESAVSEERTELAVRVSYWGEGDRARVAEIVEQFRQEQGLEDTAPWTVTFYPSDGPAGLVEFIMEPLPEETAEEEESVPPSETADAVPAPQPSGETAAEEESPAPETPEQEPEEPSADYEAQDPAAEEPCDQESAE